MVCHQGAIGGQLRNNIPVRNTFMQADNEKRLCWFYDNFILESNEKPLYYMHIDETKNK